MLFNNLVLKNLKIYFYLFNESLPGIWGNRVTKAFISTKLKTIFGIIGHLK